MASELFHELLDQAIRKDCSTIHQLNGLVAGLGASSTTKMVPLAEKLYDLGREFQDSMDTLAKKYAHPRMRQVKYRCMGCGDPYCMGAVPVVIIGDAT